MAKKLIKELAEKPKKKRSPARNKRAGNAFELEIVHKLNDIGFDTKSSRLASRENDNNKIDITDMRGDLPCNVQAKYTQVLPNYFSIRDECPDKVKPFCICWKKAGKEGKHSPGTVYIIPDSFFYELIKPYANGKSNSNISESRD